ncbi:MAG: hypothetical protein WD205_04690 [Rhodothermales bacterium]
MTSGLLGRMTPGLLGLALLLVGLSTSACGGRSDYERMVDRELARGVEYNELFLGYELGMSRQAFYDRGWELNRQGLAIQGPMNQSVQYDLDDMLPHPAKMYYYADFHDDRVFQMRARFVYDGWAPWNRNLSADSLQVDVVSLFTEWYGDGFVERGSGRGDLHYVKVDGNRRIVVAKQSDSEVVAVFTDLAVERTLGERDDQK